MSSYFLPYSSSAARNIADLAPNGALTKAAAPCFLLATTWWNEWCAGSALAQAASSQGVANIPVGPEPDYVIGKRARPITNSSLLDGTEAGRFVGLGGGLYGGSQFSSGKLKCIQAPSQVLHPHWPCNKLAVQPDLNPNRNQNRNRNPNSNANIISNPNP